MGLSQFSGQTPAYRSISLLLDPRSLEYLTSVDRQIAIDISVPSVLFCKGRSIEYLIQHKVAKYLNFIAVRNINVLTSTGSKWSIPTTRGRIFQDKELRLTEKRALMSLFKSAVSDNSSAIHSSATIGSDQSDKGDVNAPVDPTMKAVDYLRSSLHVDRAELIAGIIHGVCLFPGPASDLSAGELLERLALFIASLTQYEEGCPLLVPMYGNSDLPQAFARTAAVKGAVYILNCPWDEIRHELADTLSPLTRDPPAPDARKVFHGVTCHKTTEANPIVSLSIIPPTSPAGTPVYALALPCSETGGSPVVCPPGHTLTHFLQSQSSTSTISQFQDSMKLFNSSAEPSLFELVFVSESDAADMFNIESHFEAARRMFNQATGRDDADLPLPPDEVEPPFPDEN